MDEFSVQVRAGSVNCIRFGNKENLLLCFHGFGETAMQFMRLQDSLALHFTVIAIDLPFHGKTLWPQHDLFTRNDLKFLIDELLRKEDKQRFSVMGYSLGGKLSLAAVDEFAPQIDKLILVAPDGVQNNVWYNVGVYPAWGQKLFLRFVETPTFIFRFARILKLFGLLNKRFYKFLKTQTDSKEKRRLVHDVWICLKEFKINLSHTKSLLNRNRIRSVIFIGKYDRVITEKVGVRFSKGLERCKYILLEKGHNLITESFNEPLKQVLSS